MLRNSNILNKIVTGLLLITLTIATNIVYTDYKIKSSQKHYVVANIDSISKRFISSIIRANLTDEAYRDVLVRYDESIKKVISNISLKNNFIILKKGSVLSSLPDITIKIEELIWKEMKLDKLLKFNNK